MRKMTMLFACLSLAVVVQAQEDGGFSPFFKKHADSLVTKRLAKVKSKHDPATQQFEPPASLAPNVSLVDLTSATDLVSMALNFSGAGSSGNTQSVTSSFYSLVAGARGLDPSEPETFNSHPKSRSWFLTLGNDTGKAGTDDDAHLYQVKGILIDQRMLTKDDRKTLAGLMFDDAASKTRDLVRGVIFRNPNVQAVLILPLYAKFLTTKGLATAEVQSRVAGLPDRITADGDIQPRLQFDAEFRKDGLQNELLGDMAPVEKALGASGLASIDAVIDADLDRFVAEKLGVTALVQEKLRGAQFAVAINLRDPSAASGTKTFSLEGIFTKGLAPGLNFTLNSTYERPEGPVAKKDKLTVAALLRKQITPSVAGKTPMYFDVSADTSLLHSDRTYRAQLKAVLPITAGLQIPVSVTWANKSELITEDSKISGQVGISFDFSKVSGFFSRGVPE